MSEYRNGTTATDPEKGARILRNGVLKASFRNGNGIWNMVICKGNQKYEYPQWSLKPLLPQRALVMLLSAKDFVNSCLHSLLNENSSLTYHDTCTFKISESVHDVELDDCVFGFC
jgi:hypothetical protein